MKTKEEKGEVRRGMRGREWGEEKKEGVDEIEEEWEKEE